MGRESGGVGGGDGGREGRYGDGVEDMTNAPVIFAFVYYVGTSRSAAVVAFVLYRELLACVEEGRKTVRSCLRVRAVG